MASKLLRACLIVCFLAYGCVSLISRAPGHDCRTARAKEELSLSIPQAATNSEVHVLSSKSTLSWTSNNVCAYSASPSDGKSFPAKVLDTSFDIVVYRFNQRFGFKPNKGKRSLGKASDGAFDEVDVLFECVVLAKSVCRCRGKYWLVFFDSTPPWLHGHCI